MAEQMGLFDAIYSQRQITRYKTDPVPEGALEHMVDAAVRAPNGGNTQPWEFVVVNDPTLVRQLGELYKNTWLDAMGWEPGPDETRVYRHARRLAHHMPDVPAMIVICADHSRGSGYQAGEQPWEFVVVNDPTLVRQLGELYKNTWLDAMGWEPGPDETRVYRHARRLAHHMPDVPAMIVICADHSRGSGYQAGEPIERGRHAASIWPAIQNLFLAGRALGLGTRITTVLNRKEDEVRTILGFPEYAEMICLTPVGYPQGNFGPTTRRPASEVTSINGWGKRGWSN